MRLRRWSSALVVPALVLLAAPAAAQGPPAETPTGGGCQANGFAVAGFARDPEVRPFGGSIVRGNAPIADENVLFFTLLCGAD